MIGFWSVPGRVYLGYLNIFLCTFSVVTSCSLSSNVFLKIFLFVKKKNNKYSKQNESFKKKNNDFVKRVVYSVAVQFNNAKAILRF